MWRTDSTSIVPCRRSEIEARGKTWWKVEWPILQVVRRGAVTWSALSISSVVRSCVKEAGLYLRSHTDVSMSLILDLTMMVDCA